MSDRSKWIETILDNRNLLIHLLFSLFCFLLGLLLLITGLVKFFPPINPYGYSLSIGASNIILIAGNVLVVLSIVLYIFGTRNLRASAQQMRAGISHLYLRQYLLNRVETKFDIVNKLNVLPTPKSITNISYLLNETNSEIALLKCLSPHLLLLLEEESDDTIATEIIELIGKTKTPNTEKILMDNYKKDYLDLKTACVTALGELGSIKSRKALEKLLENPHKLLGSLLNATNMSMKKILIPSEFTLLLRNQMFDERIERNIRQTYILPALEEVGTDDAISTVKAYQLSKLESIDMNSAYEQVIYKQKERGKNEPNL